MRKIVAMIMALGLTFSSFSGLTSYAESNEYTLGDITMNGSVDAGDLLKFKRVLLGLSNSTKSVETLGDMNQDGTLNALDFLMLKRVLLGLDEAPDKVVSISPTITAGSMELQNTFVANWTKDWDNEVVDVSVASNSNSDFCMEQSFRPLGNNQDLVFKSNSDSESITLRDGAFSVNSMIMNLDSKSMTVPTSIGKISVETEENTNKFCYYSADNNEVFSIESSLDENFLFNTSNVTASLEDRSCEVTMNEGTTSLIATESLIDYNGSGFKADNFEVTLREVATNSYEVTVTNNETGKIENTYSITDGYKTVKSANYKLECTFAEDWARIGLEDFTNDKYYGLYLGEEDWVTLVTMEHNELGNTIINKYTTHYNDDGYKGLSCSVAHTDKTYSNLWNFEFSSVGDCGQTIIWKSDSEYSVCYNEILSDNCSVVLEKVKNNEVYQNEFTAYGSGTYGKIVVDKNSLGGQDSEARLCYGRQDGEVQSYYGKVTNYGLSLINNPNNGSIHSVVLLDGDKDQQVLDCNFNYDSF